LHRGARVGKEAAHAAPRFDQSLPAHLTLGFAAIAHLKTLTSRIGEERARSGPSTSTPWYCLPVGERLESMKSGRYAYFFVVAICATFERADLRDVV